MAFSQANSHWDQFKPHPKNQETYKYTGHSDSIVGLFLGPELCDKMSIQALC